MPYQQKTPVKKTTQKELKSDYDETFNKKYQEASKIVSEIDEQIESKFSKFLNELENEFGFSIKDFFERQCVDHFLGQLKAFIYSGVFFKGSIEDFMKRNENQCQSK